MTRIHKDQLGLLLAAAWALRGTCARRRVGCVLWDRHGNELSTGYNGPARGLPHCADAPCPAASAAPGTQLSACEAVHAEANALLRCRSPMSIHTCYITTSPCLDCVKLLQNTSCQRIVFAEPYAHDAPARERWLRRPEGRGAIWERTWEHVPPHTSVVAGMQHG